MADTAVHSGSEDPNRRDFIHIAAVAGAAGAAGMLAWPLVVQMNPSGDTLALASIDFDLSKVPEGQQVVVKWRGKPVFVRNRTQAQIDQAVKDDNASDLKDPQPDAERHLEGMPNMLVLIGSCTHFGCVPTLGGGDYGGWFCPCHGSHYDTSGRIRKGPAPLNLQLPEVTITEGSSIIKIG